MFILMAEVHVKPEMRDRFLAIIRENATHTEQDEPGCLRFDVVQDTEDENRFVYYEVYTEQAALAAHRETPHFKKYFEESAQLFDRETVRHFGRNVHPSDQAWR
jgi:quinol monooxygenase YgiN